ncbi:hypothetical protein [Sphingobium xenophagum]|uniref:hypothetical protein n=1 Tax=Sphingobium xenophagum TaxID=121428 RepID=UPI001C0E6EE0|nr:hypothetical protein [Sphingobium xenophagum]QWT14561.1 hypothetical protein GTV57_01925 [Sphingobium xenophagum]
MTITNTTIAGLAGSERKMDVRVTAIAQETNELVQSGLTASSVEVQALANGGPRKVSLDYIKPLSGEAFNVTNDNINSEGDVGSIEGGSYSAMRLDINYALATTDLTQIVTQYGTQGDLATALAGHRNAITKSLYFSTVTGVRAALAANAAITHEVATDWDMQVIYDAIATAEEWSSLFNVMMVSHGRYAKLQAKNDGFVAPSDVNTRFAQYQGFQLVKSNKLTDDEVVLGRTGSIGYGEASPQQAFEIERKANGAGGGGGNILHSRFSRVIHPVGMDFKGAIPTTPALVKSVLENGASWSKVAPDAQFGLRFIKFNDA